MLYKPPPPDLKLRVLRQFKREDRERTIRPPHMHACQPCLLRRGNLERGAVHAEWREEVLLQIVAQPLAAHLLDDLAHPFDIDAVSPALTRIEEQRGRERGILEGDDGWRARGSWYCTISVLKMS